MFYTILDFPLGKIFLAKSEKGLSFAISLRRQNRFEEISEFFKRKSIPLELQSKKFRQEEKLFSQYFEGEKEDFTSLPLDFISGTPYQRKVWLETRKIPYGKTRTYKSIAEKLNHRGYRSVGQALSQNPLLIVIPCHRVLSSDGSLGGFTGGLELKKFLLRIERQ
jgi:O-6-methylguanine DNA methyltransferase